MDTMKGILKAVLIACGCIVLPIFIAIIGMALTIVGPIVGGVLIVVLPAIAIGVLIGVKQTKNKN